MEHALSATKALPQPSTAGAAAAILALLAMTPTHPQLRAHAPILVALASWAACKLGELVHAKSRAQVRCSGGKRTLLPGFDGRIDCATPPTGRSRPRHSTLLPICDTSCEARATTIGNGVRASFLDIFAATASRSPASSRACATPQASLGRSSAPGVSRLGAIKRSKGKI